MKVVFICTLYAPNEIGGAERAMRIVAEALVARGHQAVVISLDPEGKRSQARINGVVVHYVPLANIYWPHASAARRPAWKRAIWHLLDAYNPMMGARVRQILAAERPDVVETNNLQGLSVSAWRAAQQLGIPVVQVVHDYYLGCPNSTMTRRGHNCASQCTGCRVYALPRRRLSVIPRVVSSVSRRTLERLESCGMFADVPTKIVAPTAFDVRHAQPLRPDKPPGTALTIGFMGRLEQIKGIEVLLSAMRDVPRSSITLLVAGAGDPAYVADVVARFEQTNIHFLGFVAPEAFFRRIDALVVPSIWEEPLGRVIFEGFSYGVPAIVSRRGGMPEIVEDGVTGFIVEPGKPTVLADLLNDLVRRGLPAERFGKACYAKSAQFGIDGVFATHMANWQKAIAGTRQPTPYLATVADQEKVT
ncbi:MAG TPA: glycosyltransferase family 4 protein [Steroidobacteraceae bacterium]|jgi:glycosyltransferase involved in cell wall biosynthesis